MAERVTWRADAGGRKYSTAEVCDRGSEGVSEHGLVRVWKKALPDLARLVSGMGYGAGSAEDVLQDVYLAAMQNDAVRMPPADLRRWLFRVAINRCRLEHRRRARIRRFLKNMIRRPRDAVPDVPEAVASRQEQQALRRALAALEVELKAPLVMRYFCGMDSKEIGRVLEMPDATVRSRLRAGRMRLAGALTKAGYGHE